ncbi:MAG: aldehyde dehydrogenase family protein [Terrimesophilobacter sp.]
MLGSRWSVSSFINGTFCEATGPETVRFNPARPHEPVTSYQQADSSALDSAVRAAVAAAGAWDDLGIIARGRILMRVGSLIRERRELLAEQMTAENGKTIGESELEVDASADTFDYHGASSRGAVGVEYPSSNPDERIFTVRRPLGVVAVITPWNFPLQIPAWKIAPALLYGNCVVWKSASNTPAVSASLMEVMRDAGVPDGVVNLLLGPGPLGSELVSRPEIAGVTFTGSVPVGQHIRTIATSRGAKLQMELGGHNASIVLPDADLKLTATSLVAASVASTGQKCTATRRVILVGGGHEELRNELISRVQELRLGDGCDPSVQIGPVVSREARDEIRAAIDLALSEGGSILAQATVPDSEGYFIPPTILTGPATMTICREEVFGPVFTILTAPTLDDAIDLANSTRFGLTASLFTSDEGAIRQCLKYLEAGLIKVNAPSTGSELHAPFGGLKDSTFAGPREQNNEAAAAFFTVEKTAYVRSAGVSK